MTEIRPELDSWEGLGRGSVGLARGLLWLGSKVTTLVFFLNYEDARCRPAKSGRMLPNHETLSVIGFRGRVRHESENCSKIL